MDIKDQNHLLTPAEVSAILGLSVETLNTWRATNRYPLPYVKVGRLVRYRSMDLQAFIESRLQVIPP
jgi:excisionase family DNA binding protein